MDKPRGALSHRPATPADWPEVWRIFQAVVATADTYAYGPETSEAEARGLWVDAPGGATFVGCIDGVVAGAFVVKPNQPGLGNHVANAAFIVDPARSGVGLGAAMGEAALEEARTRGYRAMQFNYVVSTNTRAVRLWERLGFKIVGTVPDAFRQRELGTVAVHVMHREL